MKEIAADYTLRLLIGSGAGPAGCFLPDADRSNEVFMADRAHTSHVRRGNFCDMPGRHEATIDDLYRVPEGGKADLVNGELVLMPPSGGLHGYAAGIIYASLLEYSRRTKRGVPCRITSASS